MSTRSRRPKGNRRPGYTAQAEKALAAEAAAAEARLQALRERQGR